MYTDDAVVRIQTLEGTWETIGVERYAKIRPEGLTLSANPWGSDTAQFRLRRDPGGIFPDLSAYTPAEVEILGAGVVWKGRVKETPTKDGSDASIGVSGQGKQYDFDMNVLEQNWVYNKLTEFKDARAYPTTDLLMFRQGGTVEVGDAGINLMFPNPTGLSSPHYLGVVLDLGPELRGSRIAVDYDMVNTSASMFFYARGVDDPSVLATATTNDAIGGIGLATGSGWTKVADFPSGSSKRYLALLLYYNGVAQTVTAEYGVRIKGFRLYREPRFYNMAGVYSAPTTSLKATDVVLDAVTTKVPGIQTPVIEPGSFVDHVQGYTPSHWWRMNQTGSIEQSALLPMERPPGLPVTAGLSLVNTYFRQTTGAFPSEKGDLEQAATRFQRSGSAGYAAGPNVNLNGRSYVISAWAKLATGFPYAYSTQTLVSVGGAFGVDNAFHITYSSTGPQVYTSHGTADALTAMAAGIDSNWHHFAVSYDADAKKRTLYVDGEIADWDTGINPTSVNSTIWVGTAGWNAPAQTFDGNIQDVVIWEGTALSDEAVKTIYEAGRIVTRGTMVRAAFNMPSFATDGSKTPREIVTAANAYQNWRTRVNMEDQFEFAPRASTAGFEVGAWPGAEFEDASANSGEELYNAVRIEGNLPDETILRVTRTTKDLPGATKSFFGTSEVTITNPSMAVDAIGWSAGTRVTSVFFPTAGSLEFAGGLGTQTTLLGTVRKGITYAFSIGVLVATPPSGTQPYADVNIIVPDAALADTTSPTTITTRNYFPVSAVGSWQTAVGYWTPTEDFDLTYWSTHAPLRYRFPGIPPTNPFYLQVITNTADTTTLWHIDNITIWTVVQGLLDRRGLVKTKILPIESRITIPAANQIGDVWLLDHVTTPLKGTLKITGMGGARALSNGRPVHPAEFLRQSDELVQFSDKIDPDTGALGRYGRIAGVTYEHDTRSASVQIDNARGNVEAFLARLAIVSK